MRAEGGAGEKGEPGRGRSLSAEECCAQFAARMPGPPLLSAGPSRSRSAATSSKKPLLIPHRPRGPFSGSHVLQRPLSDPFTRTPCHPFIALPRLFNRFLSAIQIKSSIYFGSNPVSPRRSALPLHRCLFCCLLASKSYLLEG